MSSIASESASTKVYFDVLNYADDFFPISRPWNVRISYQKINEFIQAAINSKIELTVFINDTSLSAEANRTWRKRREREVLKGMKNMPHGLSTLLGDIFKETGIRVLYSISHDLDDTLASLAQVDNASILSKDKDMFRYINSSFQVYGSYTLERGKLLLSLKERSVSKRSSPRDLVSPLTSDRISHVHDNTYLRGSPTPLARRLNCSPHRHITPLRRALFYLNRIEGPIAEEWPEWDAENEQVSHYSTTIVCASI